MFLGQYRHTVDTKGRLIIPARFRNRLHEGAFVTHGYDRNLMVMTPDYFALVYERIISMNPVDPVARMLRRLILGNAYEVNVDKAGRILLPPILRQTLSMGEEAILVGQGEYFEIWTPGEWDKQLALLQDADANAQRFAALDLSTPPNIDASKADDAPQAQA